MLIVKKNEMCHQLKISILTRVLKSCFCPKCRFLALPRPGLALYRNCIELELNMASIGDEDSLVNTRKLFESALATYDQKTSLWQDYHSMEIKVNSLGFYFIKKENVLIMMEI